MRSLALLLLLGVVHIGATVVETSLGEFSKAIVYNGNIAEVERVVTVNTSLTAENYHGIVVRGFVPNVKEETIRILSSNDVEVLDFKLSTSLVVKETTEEYKEQTAAYNEQLSTLRRSIASYQNEIAVLDAKMQFVNQYTTKLTQLSGASATDTIKSLEEIVAAVDYQEEQAKRYYDIVAISNQKIDEANSLISAINEKLIKMSRHGVHRSSIEPFDKTEKILTFRIKPSRETSVENPLKFFISYTSTTASWSPEYDIRIESINPLAAPAGEEECSGSGSGSMAEYRMEIDYFANVWQNTGEHWVDAMLTLSTAKPQYLQKHSEAHSSSVNFQYPNAQPSVQPGVQPTSQPGAQPISRSNIQPSSSPNIVLTAGGQQPLIQPSSSPRVSISGGSHPSSSSDITLSAGVVLIAAGGQLSSSADAMLAGSSFKTTVHSSHHYTGAASMMQSESFVTGDLGASHMFKVQYPVNVSSTDLLGLEQQTATETNSALQTYKHLILVEKVVVDCQVFTFAVPSQDPRGFMMGWGTHSAPKSSSSTASAVRSPLLASSQARLAIQGTNLGTVAFSTVMPGENIKLSLGFDQQIHISTTAVLPTHKGQEEDKSTWFVTDKKKFRVRTDERTTTIRSSHATKTVLVIVSENLPRSTEEDGVKVELLSPMAKSLVVFGGNGTEAYTRNDDCIAAVLEKESADPSIHKQNNGSAKNTSSRVYFNKLSGNLYWAQWVAAGESVVLLYKYKITWPDEKNINMH